MGGIASENQNILRRAAEQLKQEHCFPYILMKETEQVIPISLKLGKFLTDQGQVLVLSLYNLSSLF